jgi:hypothetical protein
MPTKVFIQPEGAKHVFRRPGTAFSLDNIVERPQRLRAVNCGLAAGLARLEALQPLIKPEQQQEQQQDQSDDLIKALEGLALGTPALAPSSSAQPSIVFSAPAPSGLIRSKAVEFVHHPPSDDPEEVRYLDSLVSWVKTCEGKWAAGESEIPAELPQLDLYRASPSDASVRPLSRRRPAANPASCADFCSLPSFARSRRRCALDDDSGCRCRRRRQPSAGLDLGRRPVELGSDSLLRDPTARPSLRRRQPDGLLLREQCRGRGRAWCVDLCARPLTQDVALC